MSNDYLKDVNGNIYSTPNIKQIQRELEANTHLWHHVLYEHEGGVPEPIPFVDDRGIFNLYILYSQIRIFHTLVSPSFYPTSF